MAASPPLARASALAPIKYVPELIGADTDSEPAIRWPIALMALCCDAPAIATVAAALAPQHGRSAQNRSPTDRSALVEFAPTSRVLQENRFLGSAVTLCAPLAYVSSVSPTRALLWSTRRPRHWGECV